jgi:DNA-directed RNA polymerase subunit F
MPKKIIEEQLLTLPEVKEILIERGEGNSELGYIQRVTLDYTMKFAATDREKACKLVSELVKFDFVDENMAVQIVNAMPTSIPELKVFVTEKHKVVLTSDLEKMLGIIDKYR